MKTNVSAGKVPDLETIQINLADSAMPVGVLLRASKNQRKRMEEVYRYTRMQCATDFGTRASALLREKGVSHFTVYANTEDKSLTCRVRCEPTIRESIQRALAFLMQDSWERILETVKDIYDRSQDSPLF